MKFHVTCLHQAMTIFLAATSPKPFAKILFGLTIASTITKKDMSDQMKAFLERQNMKSINIFEQLRRSLKPVKTGLTVQVQERERCLEKLCDTTFLKLSLC